MSTREPTIRQKAVVLVVVLGVLGLVAAVGLVLREHGPGNMGDGFLWGAAAAVLAVLVMAWRTRRDRHAATTFERAFTQQGDERDDAVLTAALAVLGLLALPLTGTAAVAIGLGADVAMSLALVLFGQVLVLAVAYWVVSRRA